MDNEITPQIIEGALSGWTITIDVDYLAAPLRRYRNEDA